MKHIATIHVLPAAHGNIAVLIDNIESSELGKFINRWSALGQDIRIEQGEDGSLYFVGGQGETCTVTAGGTVFIDVNYH